MSGVHVAKHSPPGTTSLVGVPSSIEPLVLDLDDACRFCGGLSRSTLYRAARQGLVTAYKATLAGPKSRNARLLFDRESLIRFVRSFERADADLRAVDDEAASIVAAEFGGRRRRG